MSIDQNLRTGYSVTFEPAGKSIKSLPGETLLDCARRAGVRIASVCGGRGLCKTCVIRVSQGQVDIPSAADEEYFSKRELKENWRRACQTFLAGDCVIEVPARSQITPTRTLVTSEDIYVQPDPVVRAIRGKVPVGTLDEPNGDDDRLKKTLNEKWRGAGHRIDSAVQKKLPFVLRETDGKVEAVSRFGEIIGIAPQKKQPLLGLAVDLGTTNIGVWLIDLRTGKTLRTTGLENPQAPHGADVITRLGYARQSPEALASLQKLVIDALNEAAAQLTAEIESTTDMIADVVVVGNTAMHHLIAGLPVNFLSIVPFIPAVSGPVDIKGRALGLNIMPGAYVHLFPNIAGFVGGDHTAVLLAVGCRQEKQTVIALDIGTNTEISLIHKGKLSSLSCPSGPAFEGGHIRCGMRSAAGAIEGVEINDDEVILKTIDDEPPVGICGSGVLEICAQLYQAGVTSITGKMDPNHPRVRQGEGRTELEFILADDAEATGNSIVFTQKDVRSVQLAKGSISSGIRILLDEAGIRDEDLDQVIIAGAFGNYIDVKAAITIGMLPDLPPERYAQIGNAAGIGAKLALVSHSHRSEAESIAKSSRYIELAGTSRFKDVFMKSMSYPELENIQHNEVIV